MFSSNRSTTTTLSFGLKVNTNSPEWHKSMTKVLNQIEGGNYWIDAENGMAYFTGQGNAKKILKLIGSKRGKDTEMAFLNTGTDHYPQSHHHQHDPNIYNNNGYQNSHYGQSSTPYWPGYSYPPAPGMQTYHHQHNPYSGGYNNYGYY